MTVATKIVFGFLIVLGLGTVALTVTYQGLKRVERQLHQLAEVHEPVSSATHEMEINVNGIAIGTLGYVGASDPRFKELVDRDAADFEQFHAKYLTLASTDREREVSEVIGRLYREFKSLGEALVSHRDEQAAAFAEVGQSFERMDELIDNRLQASPDPRQSDDLLMLEALNSVEADLAEMGMWLASYWRTHRAQDKALIATNEKECRAALARLAELKLDEEPKRHAAQLHSMFERTASRVQQIIALEDLVHRDSESFIALHEKIDHLLDEQMQPLAAELLRKPREQADAAAALVVRRVRWLIPLFVLSAAAVAFLLVRSIMRPIKLLTRGTEAISRGDLAHRIAPATRDEFSDLADAFNRMVVRLHETLVSKELLEDSERKLRETVDALQRQIAERIKSEEQRMRLQASLRRAETLSAMGSLVAGVAHQVRNPLFGMSSVLDAMEARLGVREECKQHFEVLREQAARLSTLMRELLEYGKPAEANRAAESLADVVAEAKRNVQPLTEESRVRVLEEVDDDLPAVIMDRPRLVRVFEILLENAIQHSPQSGVVTISCARVSERGDGWLECRVEDTGAGFKEEDLPHVFEPFFTRRRGGTGLGLAIVQRIVENHGGRASAQNGIHGGAMVTIRLPIGTTVPENRARQIPVSSSASATSKGPEDVREHGQHTDPADR